jgi:pimeloyl-ACP methyl ester carboxylesterase
MATPNDAYNNVLAVQGSGEPLVLVSGMDGTGKLFYRQVPLLARSYRVATYALRDAATTMEELVADLGRVVDVVAGQERRATIVGESFGGALALSFALARPEQVERLVILNSFSHFTPQNRLHLARFALRALPWGAMALARRLTAWRLHSRHTHRAEIRSFLDLTASASRDGYCNRLQVLMKYDVRHRLNDIRVPTLFLASELDHLVPSVAQAQYMAARVPGAAVRVLGGHGHICLIAPDLDLAAILSAWQRSAP